MQILFERSNNESIWLMAPLIGVVICLAIIKQKQPNFFIYTIKAPLQYRFFRLAYSEATQHKNIQYFLLLITSIILSIYIGTVFKQYNIQSLVTTLMLIILVFFIKTGLVKLSGVLFEKKELIDEYFELFKFHVQSVGLYCIPVTFLNLIYLTNQIFYQD